MWQALPETATYAHNGKKQFTLSMDSSINKLTNYQYRTAKCWWASFCWGLFLRPVRFPWVLGCPLNATCWLVQAATLLNIQSNCSMIYLVGHGFSYILWQLENNGASLWAIELGSQKEFNILNLKQYCICCYVAFGNVF